MSDKEQKPTSERAYSLWQRMVLALARLTGLRAAVLSESGLELTDELPQSVPPLAARQTVTATGDDRASADAEPELTLFEDEVGAKQAHDRWRMVDPFPKIPAALLNAADIDDYMRVAALVHPYRPSKRKTAAYPLRVGREMAFWDPDKPDAIPVTGLIEGAPVRIPSNSLVYVQTLERFQLPHYIAVRFNLHIDLVHKGLLLGTGPLVDPGFTGRLMIPLHNLTNNNYELASGDDFIWLEFTKTSPIPGLDAAVDPPVRAGTMVEFEKRKQDRSIDFYLFGARKGHPVLQPGLSHRSLRSSLPSAIAEARLEAHRARTDAEKARASIRVISWAGAIGVLLAIIGTLVAVGGAVQTTLGLSGEVKDRFAQQEKKIEELERRIDKPSSTTPPAGRK